MSNVAVLTESNTTPPASGTAKEVTLTFSFKATFSSDLLYEDKKTPAGMTAESLKEYLMGCAHDFGTGPMAIFKLLEEWNMFDWGLAGGDLDKVDNTMRLRIGKKIE